MTERKTTEIKFRVTPSFKARVQVAADAAGVSLTEWLESASEERVSATSLTGGATPLPRWSGQTYASKSWMYEGKGG